MADICVNETRCCVVEGSRAASIRDTVQERFMLVHGSRDPRTPRQVHNIEPCICKQTLKWSIYLTVLQLKAPRKHLLLPSVVVSLDAVVALHKTSVAEKLISGAGPLAYLLHASLCLSDLCCVPHL